MYKLLLIIFTISCAQVTSLNLKKHQFGQLPSKIVWMQIAGLTEEHLALLKYSYPNAQILTNFEQALCFGKTWEYNLFELRPEAEVGFLSQLTGKKNIKGECSDYSQKTIWDYLSPQGYKIGIFESENIPDESLLKAQSCEEGKSYLKNTYFWKISRKIPKDADLFHVGEMTQFKTGKTYYDRSCKSGECFSTIESNIEKTFGFLSKNTKNYLYLIRDFKFKRLLNQSKIKEAKLHLTQLDKAIGYFREISEKNSDFMLLVTSSEAKNVSFPRKGNEWQAYEKSGSFLENKKSQLISPLFVYGARAENFCGIYDQSEILSRIFSDAKQQGLEFTILNPFQN